MDNREWERFGEEIRRNVQDAVDSRDFSRLNQTITDAINGAADGITRGMKDAAGRSPGACARTGITGTAAGKTVRDLIPADISTRGISDSRMRDGSKTPI